MIHLLKRDTSLFRLLSVQSIEYIFNRIFDQYLNLASLCPRELIYPLSHLAVETDSCLIWCPHIIKCHTQFAILKTLSDWCKQTKSDRISLVRCTSLQMQCYFSENKCKDKCCDKLNEFIIFLLSCYQIFGGNFWNWCTLTCTRQCLFTTQFDCK